MGVVKALNYCLNSTKNYSKYKLMFIHKQTITNDSLEGRKIFTKKEGGQSVGMFLAIMETALQRVDITPYLFAEGGSNHSLPLYSRHFAKKGSDNVEDCRYCVPLASCPSYSDLTMAFLQKLLDYFSMLSLEHL